MKIPRYEMKDQGSFYQKPEAGLLSWVILRRDRENHPFRPFFFCLYTNEYACENHCPGTC